MVSLLLTKMPRQLNEERSLFNKWDWDNRIATYKRMTLGSYLTQNNAQKLTQNGPKTETEQLKL